MLFFEYNLYSVLKISKYFVFLPAESTESAEKNQNSFCLNNFKSATSYSSVGKYSDYLTEILFATSFAISTSSVTFSVP